MFNNYYLFPYNVARRFPSLQKVIHLATIIGSNPTMSSLPSYNFISRKQTKLFSTTFQEEKSKENIM
jgi:hypothetical protein